MKVTLIVQLKLKESFTDTFLNHAEEIISKTNKEEGCLSYKLLQNTNLENEFFFYEEYKNKEALDVHNNSSYLKNFLHLVTPMLAEEPKIDTF